MAPQKRIWRESQHPRDGRGRFAKRGGAAWIKRAAAELTSEAGAATRAGDRPRISRNAKAGVVLQAHADGGRPSAVRVPQATKTAAPTVNVAAFNAAGTPAPRPTLPKKRAPRPSPAVAALVAARAEEQAPQAPAMIAARTAPDTAPVPGAADYASMRQHTLVSLARQAGVPHRNRSRTDIANDLAARDVKVKADRKAKLNPSGVGTATTTQATGKPRDIGGIEELRPIRIDRPQDGYDAHGKAIRPGDTVTIATDRHNRTDEKVRVLEVGTGRTGGSALATVQYDSGDREQLLLGNLVRTDTAEGHYLDNLSAELVGDGRAGQSLRGQPSVRDLIRSIRGESFNYQAAALRKEARKHKGPLADRLNQAADDLTLLGRGTAGPDVVGRSLARVDTPRDTSNNGGMTSTTSNLDDIKARLEKARLARDKVAYAAVRAELEAHAKENDAKLRKIVKGYKERGEPLPDPVGRILADLKRTMDEINAGERTPTTGRKQIPRDTKVRAIEAANAKAAPKTDAPVMQRITPGQVAVPETGPIINDREDEQLKSLVGNMPAPLQNLGRQWAEAVRNGNVSEARARASELNKKLRDRDNLGTADIRTLVSAATEVSAGRGNARTMAEGLRRRGGEFATVTPTEVMQLGFHNRTGGIDTPEMASERLATLRRTGQIMPPGRIDGEDGVTDNPDFTAARTALAEAPPAPTEREAKLAAKRAELEAAQKRLQAAADYHAGGSMKTKTFAVRMDGALRRGGEAVRDIERLQREITALERPEPPKQAGELDVDGLEPGDLVKMKNGLVYKVAKVNAKSVKVVVPPGMDDLMPKSKIVRTQKATPPKADAVEVATPAPAKWVVRPWRGDPKTFELVKINPDGTEESHSRSTKRTMLDNQRREFQTAEDQKANPAPATSATAGTGTATSTTPKAAEPDRTALLDRYRRAADRVSQLDDDDINSRSSKAAYQELREARAALAAAGPVPPLTGVDTGTPGSRVDTPRVSSHNGDMTATTNTPAKPKSKLAHNQDSLLRAVIAIHDELGPEPKWPADIPRNRVLTDAENERLKPWREASRAWERRAREIAQSFGSPYGWSSAGDPGVKLRDKGLIEWNSDGHPLPTPTAEARRIVASTSPTPAPVKKAAATGVVAPTLDRARTGTYTGDIAANRDERLGDKAFTDHVTTLTLTANDEDQANAFGFGYTDEPLQVGDEVMAVTFAKWRRGIVTGTTRGGANGGTTRVAYNTPTGEGGVMETTNRTQGVMRLVDPARRPAESRAALLPKIAPEAKVSRKRTPEQVEAAKAAEKDATAKRRQRFFDEKIKGITAALNGEAHANTPDWHLQSTTEEGLVSLAKHLGVKVPRREKSDMGYALPHDRDKLRKLIIDAIRARSAEGKA